MKVAKTGTVGTSITSSLAANTTMDNAIGTLLNNDATLNSKISAMTATFDGTTLKLSL